MHAIYGEVHSDIITCMPKQQCKLIGWPARHVCVTLLCLDFVLICEVHLLKINHVSNGKVMCLGCAYVHCI